ncbi:uncharacterized protein C9orf43 homolog isoform X2 [Engystomops pustulosus]
MELDETLCRRPLCPHPQCWATLQRMERGHPRYRAPHNITRHPSREEGGLPALSVTTLPEAKTPQNGADPQHQLIIASPATVYSMYTSAAPCSMENFFPGVNSYRQIIAPSRSSGSSFSSRKTRKVKILDPSFQDTKSRDVTMIWVPNSQHKPPKTEDREKTLKVWIKDLSLKDPMGGTKRESQNPAVTTHNKQKKPPTGGCPLNLTLVGSSASPPAVRDVQEAPKEASKCRRRRPERWPDPDSLTSPPPGGMAVENRRVVLHDTREKCPAVPHTGPVYRLDQKTAAAGNEEIDLDSIRNQYYLWKKYIHLAGPSHRIKLPDHRTSRTRRPHKSMAPDQLGHIGLFPYDPDSALSHYKSQAPETPTGSLVCDTTRSPDSESRNSPPSLGESSWADEEPSPTPADTDASEDQQEISGEKNIEPHPKNVTDPGAVTAEPPGSEQQDVPRDVEPTTTNASPDPPEPAVESTGPEQRTSSPQPNPPPPSPI